MPLPTPDQPTLDQHFTFANGVKVYFPNSSLMGEHHNLIRVLEKFATVDMQIAATSVEGISGAVDFYADLPTPIGRNDGIIYIVRENLGSSDGNGLYWIQSEAWEFLDHLNLQLSAEVPYDNSGSGLLATEVQAALDELVTLAGGVEVLEARLLTVTDITNKYVDMLYAPLDLSFALLTVMKAPGQVYGIDYEVLAPKRLSWNGLALAGQLSSGDVIQFSYMHQT